MVEAGGGGGGGNDLVRGRGGGEKRGLGRWGDVPEE